MPPTERPEAQLRYVAASLKKLSADNFFKYASKAIDILQVAGGFKAETLSAEDMFDHRYDGLNDGSTSAGEVQPDD